MAVPTHIVKCPKCGQKFDTNKIQAVKISSTRYGHATCYPDCKDFVKMEKEKEKPPEEQDLIKLKDYINHLFGKDANWPLIMKQIKKYKEEEDFSYSGMLKSLIYYYDIKQNPVSNIRANGVGVIPICYKDAFNYYLAIWQANQNNIERVLNYESKTINVRIPPPVRQPLKDNLFKELEDEYDTE